MATRKRPELAQGVGKLILDLVKHIPAPDRTIKNSDFILPFPPAIVTEWEGNDLPYFTRLRPDEVYGFWDVENIFASFIYDYFIEVEDTRIHPVWYLRNRLGFAAVPHTRMILRTASKRTLYSPARAYARVISIIVQMACFSGLRIDVDEDGFTIYGDNDGEQFGVKAHKAFAPELPHEVEVSQYNWVNELTKERRGAEVVGGAARWLLDFARQFSDEDYNAFLVMLNIGGNFRARFISEWAFPVIGTTLYKYLMRGEYESEEEEQELDFVDAFKNLIAPSFITSTAFDQLSRDARIDSFLWSSKESLEYVEMVIDNSALKGLVTERVF